MQFVTRQQRLSSEQRHLLESFDKLDQAGRQSLMDYADFLVSRAAKPAAAQAEASAPAEPKPIARPASESVVKAIKRLSATYYMLEREQVLDETSSLMMSHVVQGRDAVSVIDDLEKLFEQHYQRYLNRD